MTDYYTCLTGKKVKKDSKEKLFYYPKSLLKSNLICPITTYYFTDPVILAKDRSSQCFVYERDAISEWLRTSNIEPTTGVKLEDDVYIISFRILQFIIYCLEEDDESNMYIFHSPINNPKIAHGMINFQKYGPEIFNYELCFNGNHKLNLGTDDIVKLSISDIQIELDEYKLSKYGNQQNYKKDIQIELYNFTNTKFPNEFKFINCRFVDCVYDNKFIELCDNCTFINISDNFSLEYYLVSDAIEGSKLSNKQIISNSGLLTANSDYPNRLHFHIDKFISSMINFEKFEEFKELPPFYKKFRLEYNSDSQESEKVIPESPGISAFYRANELSFIINCNPSIKAGFNKLNRIIRNCNIVEKDVIEKVNRIRKDLNLPFFNTEEHKYGIIDCSMLDFSNKVIRLCQYKQIIFAGSNLSGANIIRGTPYCFMVFSGANLEGCDHNNTEWCGGHDPMFTNAKIDKEGLETMRPKHRDKVIKEAKIIYFD